MDLVSIIMPTYRNDGQTLKRSIDSVINQTYENWELIIVDDNSEKDYSLLVKKIVDNYINDKIIYLKNETNIGSAKSRNEGIKRAQGKYITFLDDDDEYLPDKLFKQYNTMKENNSDFSLMDLDLFDNQGNLVRKRRHKYLFNETNLLKIHLKHHLTGTDTFMFKKEFILKIGLFDEIDMGDEFYLMLKAIQSNGKFSYIPETEVKAYVHGLGIGITSGKTKIDGENKLYAKKKEYFGELTKKDIKYIKMRHYLVLLSCAIKNKKFLQILNYSIMSFFNYPTRFIIFILNRKEY